MLGSANLIDVVHSDIHLERLYPAGPDRVWQAWADDASRRRWFVEGEGFEISEYSFAFRVGGQERGRFRFKDGPTIYNETVFLDIQPGRRIVYAYTMGYDTGPFTASLATIEIRPEGQGSRLVFHEQLALLTDGADGPEIRTAGWTDLLDALGRELSV
jgi:uncharacterized protein YndB with AHSA1/START domain